MANAVQAGENTPVQVLDRKLGQGIYIIDSFVREFPALAYVGFGIQNWYKHIKTIDGMNKITPEMVKVINFQKLSSIAGTMSEDGNKLTWDEMGTNVIISPITATTVTATEIEVKYVERFAVGDIVKSAPAAGSVGTIVQGKITAINTGTKILTVDVNFSVVAGDELVFLYPSLTYDTKVSREVAQGTSQSVITYIQKFGGSVKFDMKDNNTTRLFIDPNDYIEDKFGQPIKLMLNQISSAFYYGQNIAGAESQTQGLDTLIVEKEARDGVGSAIIDMSGITDDKLKIKEIVKTLNNAAKSPVYTGNEKPTVYCNTEFMSVLEGLLQGNQQYQNFIPKTIEYNLESFSTHFFKNINFIIDQNLDNTHPNTSIAYVFPKHLTTFKTPQLKGGVGINGQVMKFESTKVETIKQPIVTADSCEYTFEYWMGIIFAGQTFPNSYKRIDGLK